MSSRTRGGSITRRRREPVGDITQTGAAALIAGLLVAAQAAEQQGGSRPPVIDMHVHSTITSPAMLPRLDSLGVRYLFLTGLAKDLLAWAAVDNTRYLPALVLPCEGMNGKRRNEYTATINAQRTLRNDYCGKFGSK